MSDCTFYLESLLHSDKNRRDIIRDFIDQIKINNIEFDYIACRGASGIIFASMLAYETNKPLCIIRKEDGSHSRRKIEFPYKDFNGGNLKYIICDDLIDTASTVSIIIETINKERNLLDKCASIFLYCPLSDDVSMDNKYQLLIGDAKIFSQEKKIKIYWY